MKAWKRHKNFRPSVQSQAIEICIHHVRSQVIVVPWSYTWHMATWPFMLFALIPYYQKKVLQNGFRSAPLKYGYKYTSRFSWLGIGYVFLSNWHFSPIHIVALHKRSDFFSQVGVPAAGWLDKLWWHTYPMTHAICTCTCMTLLSLASKRWITVFCTKLWQP